MLKMKWSWSLKYWKRETKAKLKQSLQKSLNFMKEDEWLKQLNSFSLSKLYWACRTHCIKFMKIYKQQCSLNNYR